MPSFDMSVIDFTSCPSHANSVKNRVEGYFTSLAKIDYCKVKSYDFEIYKTIYSGVERRSGGCR